MFEVFWNLLIANWWLWIIVLLIFIYRLFLPTIKGFLGEKVVGMILSRLDPQQYRILHDIMVNVEGKTSQIDHVVVSNYGIFVLETKNYSGWIYGDEQSMYWTQVIYKRKEKFYNPLRQNYGHVKALKAVLQDNPDLKFIPLVVFSTKADLKVNVTSEVIYTSQLLRTIRSYDEVIMTETIRDDVYQKLSSLNIVAPEARREHVKGIRKITKPADACPRCGKELKLRTGKLGKFKGCTGYPSCRFTAQV